MKIIFALCTLMLAVASSVAGDIVIYPNGILTNNLNHNVNCPGDYRWQATYARSIANGWGWVPDTNGNTVFTATITNRTDTHITYIGKEKGDPGCGANSVQIFNPPMSIKYRFSVFGTNNPPASTNDLPLVLHNFNP